MFPEPNPNNRKTTNNLPQINLLPTFRSSKIQYFFKDKKCQIGIIQWSQKQPILFSQIKILSSLPSSEDYKRNQEKNIKISFFTVRETNQNCSLKIIYSQVFHRAKFWYRNQEKNIKWHDSMLKTNKYDYLWLSFRSLPSSEIFIPKSR